jgi:hypothetical protein
LAAVGCRKLSAILFIIGDFIAFLNSRCYLVRNAQRRGLKKNEQNKGAPKKKQKNKGQKKIRRK